jgi:hypothetical protein
MGEHHDTKRLTGNFPCEEFTDRFKANGTPHIDVFQTAHHGPILIGFPTAELRDSFDKAFPGPDKDEW